MPKNSNAARRRAARLRAAAEGISYTAALRRITEQDAGTSPGRAAAVTLLEQHRRNPVEVQACQACRHVHLAHYGYQGEPSHGCVACEQAGQTCPVYVPGGTPKLSNHVDPASDEPAPCPWLCGHGVNEHADGCGCYRCGCRFGEPGVPPPAEITYHGYPADGPSGNVVVIEAPAGTPVSVLPDTGPSPAEFSWGYGGCGPAALARCLLIAALGPAAACPACNGAARLILVKDGRLVPGSLALAGETDPDAIIPCPLCDDGYRAVPHQEFKSGVVAAWDQDSEWVISRSQIIAWLQATDPELAAAAQAWPDSP